MHWNECAIHQADPALHIAPKRPIAAEIDKQGPKVMKMLRLDGGSFIRKHDGPYGRNQVGRSAHPPDASVYYNLADRCPMLAVKFAQWKISSGRPLVDKQSGHTADSVVP